ncbi:hypothetical protein CLAIMM_01253 [Cladophialophora immunda]|nr:hypothetical protein CLAIMM_01253 [Cladophialophora immunda]
MCCPFLGLILSCAKSRNRPISSIEASAIAAREHNKKPALRNNDNNRDVIYHTDGRGAPQVEEPGSRWRFEPFKIGTDG